MGRVVTEYNKVKFEITNKEDCILYLGHILEYFEKDRDICWNLILYNAQYLCNELCENGVEIDNRENALKIILENINADLDVDLYKFKLFDSSVKLIRNEMINIIGDFDKYKYAISYNNYLSIIKNEKINGVKYQKNKDRNKLIDKFNTYRNFEYHFTSDKLCEWIEYRRNQIENNKNCGFEFGKEFNVYIQERIPYKVFAEQLIGNIAFYEDAERMSSFMKKDFESLINEKITIKMMKSEFDYSAVDITSNGFESHQLSKYKKQ